MEGEVKKKDLRLLINYIDCGRRLLLRGGRTEMLKRRTSVSSGSRWSLAYTILFWCRPFEPISRAVLRKM